uniref:E3 ubiquitin-protein ligase RMA n=1 Tax=Kalanchoe fedtschenkoi TaxID=63787 RepID=A0A7N0TP80_KALFE
MTSEYRESSPSSSSQGPSYSRSNNGDGDTGFECNICFDLAQDPIVTLCGHLFCWPCLYKWLHLHSKSQECPVCKAIVEEEKLVPLYGRGKNTTDPRSKSIPGVEIPHRPMGQRPETAPPPPAGPNVQFPFTGFGFMGGLAPMVTASFGNVAFSAGFGGLIPALLGLNLYGFPGFGFYGATTGYPQQGQPQPHGDHAPRTPPTASQLQDSSLMMLLFIILAFVFVSLVLL